jgi:predicted nucleic acid-binding Zn ribbon protein
MSASPEIKCEKCESPCEKMIGIGAGIIFKGSGFYETDFKEKKGKPPAKTDKTHSKTGESAPSKNGGTKPAEKTKSSTKAEAR